MYLTRQIHTDLQYAVTVFLDIFKIERNIHIYGQSIYIIGLRVNGTRVRQKHIHDYQESLHH